MLVLLLLPFLMVPPRLQALEEPSIGLSPPLPLELSVHTKESLPIEEESHLDIIIRISNCVLRTAYTVTAEVADPSVATIVSPIEVLRCNASSDHVMASSNGTILTNMTVKGIFLGITKLVVIATWEGDEPGTLGESRVELPIGVKRKPTVLDTVFFYSVLGMICFATLGFGATIDMGEMRTILRRPVAPAIGAVCQYLIMPPLAFGIAYLLNLEDSLALGLFAYGCSPGGGASNIWCLLLGGNVDLSIALTFTSTILSIGMVPLWMYTLGTFYTIRTGISIPFDGIAGTVMAVIIPITFGVILSRYLPKVANVLTKILKPFAAVYLVYVCSVGSYFYRHIFYLLFKNWKIVAACCSLPLLGFTIAALIALAFRQNYATLLTIAIEVSVQNTGVAVLLLISTLPQPVADLSVVLPLSASFVLPIPFAVAALIKAAKGFKDRRYDLSSVRSVGLSTRKQSTTSEQELTDVSTRAVCLEYGVNNRGANMTNIGDADCC